MATHPLTEKPLVKEYFSALIRRDLACCEELHGSLAELARIRTDYRPWERFFTGVLADERDHDWARAEQMHLAMLDEYADAFLRGQIFLWLGVNYSRQGRLADAVRVCRESVAAFSPLDVPYESAQALKQLAICLRRGYTSALFPADVLVQSEDHCKSALALLAATDDQGYDVRRLTGSLHNTLGLIVWQAGDLPSAVTHFQVNLELCTALSDEFGTALSHGNLGIIYKQMGRSTWEKALDHFKSALAIFRRYADLNQAFEVLGNIGSLYRDLGKNRQAIAYFEQAFQLVESLRSGLSSEKARSSFFGTITHIYDEMIAANWETCQYAQSFYYMERARARAFLDVLTLGSDNIKPQAEATTHDLVTVQQHLNADDVLLAYYVFPRSTFVTGQAGGVALLVITRTDVYPLMLDVTAVAFRCEGPINPETRFLERSVRRAFYDRLVAPAAEFMAAKNRIYIIPNGPLHNIPFHALLAPDGDTLLRANGPEIVYAPSATILFRPTARSSRSASTGCLAVGYNGDPGTELRFAEAEADYIAQMSNGISLLGPSGKKEALFRRAPGQRVLHFSCHGDFDRESPLDSALYVGAGERLTGREIIAHMSLNCDLVTLSACESGRSMIESGDELYGLVRAFMYAGAPSILATLWRVDERSTLIFAEKFYELVQNGLAYATALKEAQLYLKGLTRKEAVRVLTRHLASAEQAAARALLVERADKYLKHLTGAGDRQTVSVSDRADLNPSEDDKVFADPIYWASFVLIGAPDRDLSLTQSPAGQRPPMTASPAVHLDQAS